MRRQLDHRAGVVFAPHALHDMAAGFCEIASLLASTLGPERGPVWHANGGRVERLSDSGVIARRIVELPDRLQNTGAMQLRHLVWRMQEHYGDGGATAAVVAVAMVHQAIRYVSAGADPRLLREGMESSLRQVELALEDLRLPPDRLAVDRLIAASLSYPEIASVLAEMVDVLGSDATIHLEVMAEPYLDHSYSHGGFWKLQPLSREILPAGTSDLVIEFPLMLVADDETFDTLDLIRSFELAVQGGGRPLLIIGAKLTREAEDLLKLNVARGVLESYAVSLATTGAARHQVLQDLAAAVGADVISSVSGFSPALLQSTWLGSARQVVLKRDSAIVLEGDGDHARIQQRKNQIQQQIGHVQDNDALAALRARASSLSGGVGTLQIGGVTRAERDDKRRNVERTIRVLPELIAAGQVPGGGLAFLRCRAQVLGQRGLLGSSDQRLGADVVLAGLEAPFKQLVRNGGKVEPTVALQRVTDADYRLAFDASTDSLVPLDCLPAVDSLAVLRGAIRLAISTVGELITIGATILPIEHQRAVNTNP